MSAPARRPWIWIILSTVALGLAGGVVFIAKNWPFTQAAITQTLEERFARQVVIGSFRETWFPPGCVANDVKFLHRKHKELPPLFSAKNLIIQSSWSGLLARSIGKIKIVGLRMTIPPSRVGRTSPVMPVTDPNSKVAGISEIEANDAILEFLPGAAGGTPRTMQVHQLVLDHVKTSGPVSFRCSLRTDKPDGEVTAIGTAGPWNSENPGETPISGQYKYASADLTAFHGLRGLLSARGNFQGILSKTGVDGAVSVPGFHVDDSARSVNLTADFRASVDSHSADTILESVRARVGHTTILASGDITGGNGTEGKTARIQMAVNSGRVEDLLNYFSSEKNPAMTGAVRLKAYVELPPGPGFLKKVRLDGDFGVAGSKFTNPARQEPVDRLADGASVSNLRGHVVMRNGTAALTNVGFSFPGSTATMVGNYNLLAKTVDIKGVLRTDGKLSDTATGFKAVILKVATPFFKKKHTTVFPFTIKGPASQPKIGLDWH